MQRPPESWCWDAVRELRWPGRVQCPHCYGKSVTRHRISGYARHYRCRMCRAIFSDLTGSPFHRTRINLSLWFAAIRILLSDDRFTARGLARALGVDLKTGRRMRRILVPLRHDPLIRAIGARTLSWTMNGAGQPAGTQTVMASSSLIVAQGAPR